MFFSTKRNPKTGRPAGLRRPLPALRRAARGALGGSTGHPRRRVPHLCFGGTVKPPKNGFFDGKNMDFLWFVLILLMFWWFFDGKHIGKIGKWDMAYVGGSNNFWKKLLLLFLGKRNITIYFVGRCSFDKELHQFYVQRDAAEASGTVRCWGWGEFGQLGNGRNLNSLYPVRVQPLDSWWFMVSAYVCTSKLSFWMKHFIWRSLQDVARCCKMLQVSFIESTSVSFKFGSTQLAGRVTTWGKCHCHLLRCFTQLCGGTHWPRQVLGLGWTRTTGTAPERHNDRSEQSSSSSSRRSGRCHCCGLWISTLLRHVDQQHLLLGWWHWSSATTPWRNLAQDRSKGHETQWNFGACSSNANSTHEVCVVAGCP